MLAMSLKWRSVGPQDSIFIHASDIFEIVNERWGKIATAGGSRH
ncbi:hypothetical protein [Methylobacterium aquaticum]